VRAVRGRGVSLEPQCGPYVSNRGKGEQGNSTLTVCSMLYTHTHTHTHTHIHTHTHTQTHTHTRIGTALWAHCTQPTSLWR
jgi:hypothetical protein